MIPDPSSAGCADGANESARASPTEPPLEGSVRDQPVRLRLTRVYLPDDGDKPVPPGHSQFIFTRLNFNLLNFYLARLEIYLAYREDHDRSPARTKRTRRHPAVQSVPDAPTLCEGWKTRDLAAHLVVRERRPDATLGIAVPFLADYTAKVQNKVAQSTRPGTTSSNWCRPGHRSTHRSRCLTRWPIWARCSSTTRTCVAPSTAGSPECSTNPLPRSCAAKLGLMSRMMLSKLPAQVVLQDAHW